MNKPLSSVNLIFELHVVSTFWLESDTSGTFSWHFTQPPLKLDRPALKIHIVWCRTDICSWKLSAKVLLMLSSQFPVLFLSKLKHISDFFTQKSMRITCKWLIPFGESHVFLERSPVFLTAWSISRLPRDFYSDGLYFRTIFLFLVIMILSNRNISGAPFVQSIKETNNTE